MNVSDIKKGLFVTQNDYPDSFAILANEQYKPSEGGETEQLLLCYYNPTHYEQDSNGNWISSGETFSIEFAEDSCEYTISDCDMQYWRECTEKEKEKALRLLADKKIVFEEHKKDFRKMYPSETLSFGPRPANTPGIPTTRPPYNNPYYNHGGSGYNQQHTSTTVTRKTITRVVSDNWEQKEPITVMTEEHRELVLKQCDKLKYAFYTTVQQSFIPVGQGVCQGVRRDLYGDPIDRAGWDDYWDGEYYE